MFIFPRIFLCPENIFLQTTLCVSDQIKGEEKRFFNINYFAADVVFYCHFFLMCLPLVLFFGKMLHETKGKKDWTKIISFKEE